MDLSSIPTGMWVLCGVALTVAVLCHWRLGGFWRAVVVSTIATPFVFFVASVVQERGMPGPLSVEALGLFGGFSLLISLLVGAAFMLGRFVAPSRA